MVSSLNDWKVLHSLEAKFVASVNFIAVTTYKWCIQCALLVSNGEVFAVGSNGNGCLGLASTTSTDVPCKIKELSGVAGVCVCGYYGDALAYTKDGKVYVWGDNVNGTSCKTPTLVSGLTDVVDARCVIGHYLAVTKRGKVYEWRGKETEYLKTLARVPTLVTINEVIVGIACSGSHSLALTEKGYAYSWGMKCIQTSDKVEELPLTKISILGESIAKVACGWRYSLVLTRSRRLFTWGFNHHGLGNRNNYSATAVQVGGDIGRFTDIATNCVTTSAAVTDTGAVYKWGHGGNGKSMKTPTLTQHTELHRLFADIPSSNYVWKCNSSDSINAAGYASNGEELDVSKRKDENLRTDVINLQDKLKELETEIIRTKRFENEHLKQYDALKSDNTKLQEKLETLEQEHVKQLELLREEHLKQFEKSKNDNIILEEKLNQLLKENNLKLQNKLVNLEKIHKEQEETLERLHKTFQNEERIEMGIAKLGELAKLHTVPTQHEEYDRKNEENAVILHKTLRLESDYSKLQVEFCGLAKEHGKLEGKLESLEKLYMKLQDKSERLDKSCIKQKEKLKRLEEDIKTQAADRMSLPQDKQ